MGAVTSPQVRPRQQAPLDALIERLQPEGIPLLFEDEGLEMGESSVHTRTCDVVRYGLEFHFAKRRSFRVFSNLNLYYSEADPTRYVSPDIMVVELTHPLPEEVSSYQIGEDGPGPRLVTEVLSFRTWQEGDLSSKPVLYAELGVSEYILIDITGEMLPRRLLLLRRQEDGTWAEEQDEDGGVTSKLGFRFILDKDGHLRVLDTRTGKRYARPEEAQDAVDRLDEAQTALDRLDEEAKGRRKAERVARAEAKARQEAEEQLRKLQEELARLRSKGRKRKGT